jgi:hypothetical protein
MRRTVCNYFIVNLAVADLLQVSGRTRLLPRTPHMCVQSSLSLWLTPLYLWYGEWLWGVPLCHLLPTAQGTSIFVSTLTLMMIAVDR